jgi:nicotinamide riboside transporter PnuC
MNLFPAVLIRRPDTIVLAAASLFLAIGSAAGLLPFSRVEVAAFVSGAVCVWLVVKDNVWNWPVGIANNALFVVLFLEARLYADTALQLVFISLGAYGWWFWLHGGATQPARDRARQADRGGVGCSCDRRGDGAHDGLPADGR